MTLYFADTAALAKRYVAERGSPWIQGLTQPSSGHVFIISEITTVEMASVLAAKQRARAIPLADLERLFSEFLWHADNEYLVVDLEKPILLAARNLLFKHVLRTMDAVQLASCSAVSNILGEFPTFLTADIRLTTAASIEGFTVDDPRNHP